MQPDKSAKRNPLNAIFKWKAMRMSLQPPSAHLGYFFYNFSRLHSEWKKSETMPKTRTKNSQKEKKGPNKKKCLTVWERRCQDDGWGVLAHCGVQGPGTRGLDLDLNEIFGTALGEFIASNQQARNTEQLMTLQWKTKREIMSFPFVPVSPSINRNMQHTQSESAKSIPVLL